MPLCVRFFLHFQFSHFETIWNINGTQSVLIKLVSNHYFSIQASSISSIFCRKAPLANGLAGTLFFQVSFYGHFFNFECRAFSLFNFYLVHVSMKHFFKLKLCWVKKMEEGKFFLPIMVCIDWVELHKCSKCNKWGGEKVESREVLKLRITDNCRNIWQNFCPQIILVNQHITATSRKYWNCLTPYCDFFLINPSFPTAAMFSVGALAFFPCC